MAKTKTPQTPIEKTLSFYGEQFECKFIKSMIENPTDFIEISAFLHPSDVTDSGLQQMVGIMLKFLEKKGRPATWKELEYAIKEAASTEEKYAEVRNAYMKVVNVNTDALDDVATIGMNFLKQQEILRVFNKNTAKLKKDGYDVDTLGNIISELRIVEAKTKAHTLTPYTLFETVMKEGPEERITTGIPALDKRMNGGLARGTMGTIVAGTGVGKTTTMSYMATKIAIAGFKVLYILFEDKETDMARKSYCVMTGLPNKDFFNGNPVAYQKLREEVANHPEYKNVVGKDSKLKYMRLKNGETTVEEIKAAVRMLDMRDGWKPDVVFIDYLSCIQPSSDKRLALTNNLQATDRAIKKLDAFAEEGNFALWLGQQSNRNDLFVERRNDNGGNVQGSIALIQTAAANLFIFRNKDNPDDWNRADFSMPKCRGGEPAKWTNVYFNRGTCQIDFENSEIIDPTLAIVDEIFESNPKNYDTNGQTATYQLQQGTAGYSAEISERGNQ